MELLEHFFRLKDHKTTVSTEIAAGFTTFITMSYIILVNPELIASGVAAAGGPSDAVFNGVLIATCLASFIGTILMALYAKLPLAQAPGMGINAFFAFSVIVGFGMTYQEALAIVFISGVLFILITACGLRELIIRCIPTSVQEALPVGIGMFIAFVGMQNAGLVVHNDSTLIAFADFSAISDPDQKVAVYGCLLALLGLFIMAALHALHVKAAILIGIIAVTIIGIPLGVTTLPESFSVNFSEPFSDFTTYSLGSFIEGFGSLFAGQNLLSTIFTILILVLSFSLVDMFDTLGALISVSKKVDFKDADGNPVGMKKALMCDAIATTAGAACGTSTVTTYMESISGIGAGGRTGLTSLTTAVLLLLSILALPFVQIIPSAATAPALIFVGAMMLPSLKNIQWDDFSQLVPAFLTIAAMPFAYSIATAIALGLISHIIIKLLCGKVREIHWLTAVLGILFLIRFFVLGAI